MNLSSRDGNQNSDDNNCNNSDDMMMAIMRMN